MFDAPAKFQIVFFLVWIVIIFAGWVSFQLWWDRRLKVLKTSNDGDEFVATPVISHLIQTIGEWLGTWVGIVGFFVALITTIFLDQYDGLMFLRVVGIDFLETGIVAIAMFPIIGFLIIIATRFVAELYRAIASIANNTKKADELVTTIIEDNNE